MRNLKSSNQIQRVDTLLDMTRDKLLDHFSDCRDYEKWKQQNPEGYWYDERFRTNPTELKRLMLVLRQEMIKLEKML